MAFADFNAQIPYMSYGSRENEVVFDNRKVPFGDGYEQVSGHGLNSVRRSWTCTFKGTNAQVITARDFLLGKKGRVPVLFVMAGDGVQYTVIFDKIGQPFTPDDYDSAIFEADCYQYFGV